jgi:hypothetical protein
MPTPLATIADLFEIRSRGIVIVTDVPARDWRVPLRAGDPIEIHHPGQPPIRTKIQGFEHPTPYNPDRGLALLLPPDITKAMITPGAQLCLPDRPT